MAILVPASREKKRDVMAFSHELEVLARVWIKVKLNTDAGLIIVNVH